MNSRKTIIPLVTVAAAITIAGRIAHGEKPRPRIFIGGLFVAVFLSAISDFAPQVAVGFAVVIFITALLTAGPDVIRKLAP